MRKSKWIHRILCIMIATFVLTGCGQNDTADMAGYGAKESTMAYADTSEIYEEAVAGAEATGSKTAVEENGSQELTEAATDNRKLIKNVDMQVETEAYDALLVNVQNRVQAIGGYVENLNSGEDGSSDCTRYASVTARVPADKVDQFVTEVSEISNVTSKNINVEDVTLQYTDIESHKKALLTEQERLMKLLENAESMEDIVTIEGRLSDVRYQLESMESQLRLLDNQISYSTVSIYIMEVSRLSPTETKGVWNRITTGFVHNLYRVGKGIENFGISLIINLPIIVTVVVILFVVIKLIRIFIKYTGRKKENRQGLKWSRVFGKRTKSQTEKGETTDNSTDESSLQERYRNERKF